MIDRFMILNMVSQLSIGQASVLWYVSHPFEFIVLNDREDECASLTLLVQVLPGDRATRGRRRSDSSYHSIVAAGSVSSHRAVCSRHPDKYAGALPSHYYRRPSPPYSHPAGHNRANAHPHIYTYAAYWSARVHARTRTHARTHGTGAVQAGGADDGDVRHEPDEPPQADAADDQDGDLCRADAQEHSGDGAAGGRSGVGALSIDWVR